MKVGIDTFGCDNGRSGLGSYVLSLVSSLPQDKSVVYDLFGPEVDRYTYTRSKDYGFTSVNLPDSLTVERLWHSFRINRFGRRNGYDVILYAAGARILPQKFKVPGVAVVNDVVSSLFKYSDDHWLRKCIKKGLSSADTIIAASEYIKQDLTAAGITPRRVKVVYNGINHSMFYPAESVGADGSIIDIKPFAIKKPYLIYPSRVQNEGKKHVELIKAFSRFKEKTHLPHRLVIAGSEGPYVDVVRKTAAASCAASDIFMTGYFPHENFPELYRNADACLFPSVNEGVGLPVLESLACGLPVACSAAGALHEIAGENALYFDSDDIEAAALAIERIVTDTGLRERLSRQGIQWARQFSWEKTAAETAAVLQEVAASRRRKS